MAMTRSAAIAEGNLHFDLQGEKLRGRFVLVRRGRDGRGGSGDREQWLLLKKRDEDAGAGWDPEQFPRSVKSSRTNDEVRASPSATWSSTASWVAPTADELEALADLPNAGTWRLGEHTLKLTNLDRVLFPARAGHAALTKRDLIRHHTEMAPVMLPYLADRPVNMHRYPNGVDKPGFWHKAVPSHAPEWLRRWRNVDADPGETGGVPRARLAGGAGVGRQLRGHRAAPVDLDRAQPAPADVGPDGHRSGLRQHVRRRPRPRPAAPNGTRAPRRAGQPKVSGQAGIQIWIPVAERYTFDQTRKWVETLSRAIGATVPELVSWEWEVSKRAGRARLDYTQNAHQQDARGAVQRPAGARRAGLRAHRVGRARRPRAARRSLDDPQRRRADPPIGRPAGPLDRVATAPPCVVTRGFAGTRGGASRRGRRKPSGAPKPRVRKGLATPCAAWRRCRAAPRGSCVCWPARS